MQGLLCVLGELKYGPRLSAGILRLAGFSHEELWNGLSPDGNVTELWVREWGAAPPVWANLMGGLPSYLILFIYFEAGEATR